MSSSASLIAAFRGKIEPTRVTLKYKIGLVVVALGMALLSAVYLGLILLVSYGVYYHLVHHANLLGGTDGNVIRLGIYFGPALAGLILVFFLVKPYFAGKPPEPDRYTLTAKSDPVLFAFIARICELVKAPLPSRVDVDCQVNASASFRRGLRSLGGNDVVLTIGLPLAAGLNMQEFAGVLAHEFGHFAQGAGMRLTYIIRATSRWFARVVYERDEWDLELERAAGSVDIRLGIFLHLTRFCVWLSRRILWVLMHLGHAFSGYMLRQMEFDADSYEAKLTGSAAFARTIAKIQNLAAAAFWAHAQMEESWRNRRLPANLPDFINLSVRNLPPELRAEIEKAAGKKTRIFDTHPCDADRVRAAARLNQPGIFHLTEPAASLFNDFNALSTAASRFHYESQFELRITEHNLVPQEVMAMESQTQAEGEAALRDFFFGLELPYRPILLSGGEPLPTTREGLVQSVLLTRQVMKRSAPAVQKALSEYEQAEALYQCGLDALVQRSQQATAKASAIQQSLEPTLTAFEGQARARLLGALRLLQCPEVADKIGDAAALRREADRLTPVFDRLGQAFIPLQALRRKTGAITAAFQAQGHKTRAAEACGRIDELAPELGLLLAEIKKLIQDVPYPFHHPREDLTLHEFARTDIPATHKLEALYNDCACHLNRLLPLYQRVLGRLAFIAIKVEEQT